LCKSNSFYKVLEYFYGLFMNINHLPHLHLETVAWHPKAKCLWFLHIVLLPILPPPRLLLHLDLPLDCLSFQKWLLFVIELLAFESYLQLKGFRQYPVWILQHLWCTILQVLLFVKSILWLDFQVSFKSKQTRNALDQMNLLINKASLFQ